MVVRVVSVRVIANVSVDTIEWQCSNILDFDFDFEKKCPGFWLFQSQSRAENSSVERPNPLDFSKSTLKKNSQSQSRFLALKKLKSLN